MKNIQSEIKHFLSEIENKININLHIKEGIKNRPWFSGWGYVGFIESDTSFHFDWFDENRYMVSTDLYGQKRFDDRDLLNFKNEILKSIIICLEQASYWAEGWGHKKSKYLNAIKVLNKDYEVSK